MFLWLNPHLEIFTPSPKLNPHLCSSKCPTPTYTEGLEKPSTPHQGGGAETMGTNPNLEKSTHLQAQPHLDLANATISTKITTSLDFSIAWNPN